MDLSRLACEALGTSSQDVGKAWALEAFDAWHELHAELRSRLEIHKLPPAMKLEEKQENCSQSVGDIAACSASALLSSAAFPVVTSTLTALSTPGTTKFFSDYVPEAFLSLTLII